MNYFEVGDRIREFREKANLSQDELAELADIHRVTLSRYESGKVDPGTQALARIADALGITTDKLLGREPPNKNEAELPRTKEAIILAAGVDRMPEKDRKKAVEIMNTVFDKYADFFIEGNENNDDA